MAPQRIFHYNVHLCKNEPKAIEAFLNDHADKGYEPYHMRPLGERCIIFLRQEFESLEARTAFRAEKASRLRTTTKPTDPVGVAQ